MNPNSNSFFVDYGGRLTDNRSSCVIMQELRKKENLKQEDSLGFRKFLVKNGKQVSEQNFSDLKTRYSQ